MGRLLVHQINHLKERVSEIAYIKRETLFNAATKAADKVKKPHTYTNKDAWAYIECDEMIPGKWPTKKFSNAMFKQIDATWGARPVSLVSLVSLVGLDKVNDKRNAKYIKDQIKAKKPFQSRIKAVTDEEKRIVDAVIFEGTEGFELALAKFAAKEF